MGKLSFKTTVQMPWKTRENRRLRVMPCDWMRAPEWSQSFVSRLFVLIGWETSRQKGVPDFYGKNNF